MAQDEILNEIRGTTGAAVTEPEDPVVAEIRRVRRQGYGPEFERARPFELQPGVTPLSEAAARLGEPGIPFAPPAPPALGPTHFVPGMFGEPELPEFLQSELAQQAVETTRRSAEFEKLGPSGRIERAEEEELAAPEKPLTTAQKIERAALSFLGLREEPGFAEEVVRGARQRIPLEAAIPRVTAGPGMAPTALARGLLAGTSGLLTPENIALLTSMEGAGGVLGRLAAQSRQLYAEAEAAAVAEDWARAGQAFSEAQRISRMAKPLFVINQATGYYFSSQFAMGMYQNYKGIREGVNRGDWEAVAEQFGELVPNAAFTAEGVRSLFSGISRVRAGMRERTAARAARGPLRPEPTAPETAPRLPEEVPPTPPVVEPAPTPEPITPVAPPAEPIVPEAARVPAGEAEPPAFRSRAREEIAVAKPPTPEERAKYLRTETLELERRLREGGGTSEERAQAEQRIEQNRRMLAEIERAPEAAPKVVPQVVPPVEPPTAAPRRVPMGRFPGTAIPPRLQEGQRVEVERADGTKETGSIERAPDRGVVAVRFDEAQEVAGVPVGRIQTVSERWVRPIEKAIPPTEPAPVDKTIEEIRALAAERKPPEAPLPVEGRREAVPTEPVQPVAEAREPVAAPPPIEAPPTKGATQVDTVIRTNQGDQRVSAWAHPELKGLLVTPTLGSDLQPTGEWNVTHRVSGYKVTEPFSTARAAMQAAGKIAPVADWTQDWLNAPPSKLGELKKAIDAALKGIRKVPRVEYQPAEKPSEPAERPIDREAERRRVEPEAEIGGERAPTAGIPPLGEPSERALEAVPPEDVRRVGEIREAPPEGRPRREADRRRAAERGVRRPGLPERVGGPEGEVSVPPERGGPAEPRPGPGQTSAGERAGNDYRITDRDRIGEGGARGKFRTNLAAIRTLREVEQEGRLANPKEQATLVKYVGWGGISQVFKEEPGTWADEQRELKNLLSDEEYRAARASTPNAHYTSLPVITAIWRALGRMGFRDGRILEPGAGVGHFFGVMPPELAAITRKTAIELDPLSGRILRQLYQTADVRIQGFEKFGGPNNYFDLSVGNVPFGNYKVNDPGYNRYNLSIHNYFIVKALDKLRPGGIAALITSHHTMDAVEPKARKLMAERGDLLGAIRLPNTAFKGNASTEVTADILFFRKRAEGERPSGEPFEKLKEITSRQGNAIPINEYFAAHPDMMLGDMELAGTMRRAQEPALIPREGADLAEELAKAIGKLPENSVAARKVPESVTPEATAESIPDFKQAKPYGLILRENKVYRRVEDQTVPLSDYPKALVQNLKGMLGVRDTVRELFQAESADRPATQLADLRARLNRSYDRFVQQFGYMHEHRNQLAMEHDPDLPLLLSLEDWDRRTKTAKKADVFFKQTVAPRRPVEHVETAKDALLVSLSEKGRPDFEHMVGITGKAPEELQTELKAEGLIFHNPQGHWETSDAYLSGNVRKKLIEAREAAESSPEFLQNVRALEAVQPEDKLPSKIEVRLGSPWVPQDLVRDFANYILGGQGRDEVAVKHVTSQAIWTITEPWAIDRNVNATVKWGTGRMNAIRLIEVGLNAREPVVYDRTPDDKNVVNIEETLAAKEKLEALNAEFKRWLFQESGHGEEMARIYNDTYNAEVLRKFDGSHLSLPGSAAGVVLRPHQKDGIWRGVTSENNVLLGHVVGGGKSWILSGIAMEWRRLGHAKKPMIVVPNNIVQQIAEDHLRLYPMANILAATKQDFETDRRPEFMSRVATGDWDAVIVGHSQFGLLPVSDETFNRFMQEQLSSLEGFIHQMRDEEGRSGPTVKELEKSKKRLLQKIEQRAAREMKDSTVNFENLGVDALLVDEAHYFKRLWFQTRMGRVPGIPTGDSNRAMDMFLKTQYIAHLNGGKNIVFSTGTPISNTMAEMYVMSKYLDDDALKELGLEHFDSWAANFGTTQTKLEVRPEDPSRMRMHSRFSKFVNVREMTRLFRRTADIKTAEELNLPRPTLEGGRVETVVLQPSPQVLEYIADLGRRADEIRGKRVEKGGDNMLKITTDGRKVATDYRLIDPAGEDNPSSKVNAAIQRIAQIYHDKRESRATQLVMLDIGVPSKEAKKAGRFSLYDDIKRKLIRKGIPAEEIKFIQDFEKDDAKVGLYDDMNDGKVRVLIGSTPLLGVGVNVQKKLYALHHIDAPLRPADIEQREGRILRQGNENPEVKILRYVTERTFDAYIWQLLENKAQFIKQGIRGETDEMEDVDDFSLSAAEVKALATGNPLVMRKVETEVQLEKLRRLQTAHADQQFDNRTRLARLPEEIEGTRQGAIDYEADARMRDEKQTEKFRIEVGGEAFTERKDAGAALNEAILRNYRAATTAAEAARQKPIGTFAGFSIRSAGRRGVLVGKHTYDFSINEENPLGTVQSLESSIRRIDEYAKRNRERIPELEKELKDRQAEVGKPFPQQTELDRLSKEKAEIDIQLGTKERGAGEEAIEEPERRSEAGIGTMDLLTFGLPSLYRRVLGAWKRLREAKQVPRARPPTEAGEAPVEPEEVIPTEPPGEPQRDRPVVGAEPGERAINIRLDKMNTSDDVLNLIRDTAKQHEGRIQFQRRYRLADKELKRRMDEVGLDAEKLRKLPRGRALNEAEIEVAFGIMLDKGDQVVEAQRAFQKNDTTENLLRAQQLHSEYVAIQAAVSGAVAESGRALRIQRTIAEALRSEKRSSYERVMESLGGRDLAAKEAQKLLQIPDEDKVALYKFLREHARFTTGQKIVAYWTTSLLSSPRTAIRKMMGDATMVALNVPKTFLRAAIDPLVARLQRRPREFYMRDAIEQTLAFFGALPEGMKRAAFVLKNGFELGDAEELGLPYRYELPGGYATNYPTRNLAAATTMFKIMHYQSVLAADAMRVAIQRGLTGDARAQAAAELYTDPPDEMISRAWDEARKLALVERPDSFLRAVLRLRAISIPKEYPVVGGLAPLNFVIPFVNIGWNLGKNAVRYSPLGAARIFGREARRGPEASNILAEALLGSLILAMFASWAAQGNITGAAPKSPSERDAFYRAGKQPFSIKIGSHWVSYTAAWGAMAPALAATAAWYDSYRENGKQPITSHLSEVAATIGAAANEQPFFRGIQDLVGAVTDPQHKADPFVGEIAGGFVPYSALLRSIAQALDPTVRSPQGIYERIKAELPILSKTVPARVDVLGRERTRRGAEGAKAFLPSAIPEAKPLSDVDAELARLHDLGLREPGFPARYVTVESTKIPLGPAEQNEYQRLRGTLVRQTLEKLFASEEYERLADEDKIKETETLIRDIDAFAKDEMVSRIASRRLGERSEAIPMEAPR